MVLYGLLFALLCVCACVNEFVFLMCQRDVFVICCVLLYGVCFVVCVGLGVQCVCVYRL